jgi:hypothetical protein
LSKSDSQAFDRARDELFSHINRCGVLRASADQQVEWMNDTMEFMAERFPDLSQDELGELRSIGIRFCQPVIERGPATPDEAEPSEDSADATSAAA